MCPSPSVGRQGVKAFRLSDIDIEIRLKAAQKVADAIARSGVDHLEALFETLKLDAIAQDPEKAAETMQEDCRNEIHFVALEDWEKATSPRRRW